MDIFIPGTLFTIGLFIGSFLNVVIDRVPHGETILTGRSRCDSCRHTLGVVDLVPVLSFLFLGGRCRYCHAPLSWQYPGIELLTGLSFALVYLFWAPPMTDAIVFLFPFFLVSVCIAITVTDYKYRIIPDGLTLVLFIITLFFHIYSETPLVLNIAAAAGFFGFFYALVLITKGKGMGWGDVKFAGFMGLLLGFPKIIVAFYLSFLTGAVISLILVLAKKTSLKSAVPFGPFLVGATLITYGWGDELWRVLLSITGLSP